MQHPNTALGHLATGPPSAAALDSREQIVVGKGAHPTDLELGGKAREEEGGL